MPRCVLLTLLLVFLGTPSLAGADEPSSQPKPPNQRKITGDQGLERQKTIVWLEAMLKELMPTAEVKFTPGRGNSIILSGTVKQDTDIDRILKIAESQRGAFHGDIINSLVIAENRRVEQVERACNLFCVSGLGHGLCCSVFGALG